jgi:hypothetical protein
MNINIVEMSNVLLIVMSRSGAIMPLNIDKWEASYPHIEITNYTKEKIQLFYLET